MGVATIGIHPSEPGAKGPFDFFVTSDMDANNVRRYQLGEVFPRGGAGPEGDAPVAADHWGWIDEPNRRVIIVQRRSFPTDRPREQQDVKWLVRALSFETGEVSTATADDISHSLVRENIKDVFNILRTATAMGVNVDGPRLRRLAADTSLPIGHRSYVGWFMARQGDRSAGDLLRAVARRNAQMLHEHRCCDLAWMPLVELGEYIGFDASTDRMLAAYCAAAGLIDALGDEGLEILVDICIHSSPRGLRAVASEVLRAHGTSALRPLRCVSNGDYARDTRRWASELIAEIATEKRVRKGGK